MRISGFSSLLSAITVLLHPPTVKKRLTRQGKSDTLQPYLLFVFFQKPGDHPNFRKNALGVKRPLSELSESSGVFSEQLSELEIPFSEYEIPFSEWPFTT